MNLKSFRSSVIIFEKKAKVIKFDSEFYLDFDALKNIIRNKSTYIRMRKRLD